MVLGENCKFFNPTFKDDKPCLSYVPNGNNKGYCSRPEMYHCLVCTKPITLSHSSVQDYLTCHRLFYLRKFCGIQVKKPMLSDALKRGKLWDIVMQHHHGGEVDIAGTIQEHEIPPREVAKVKAVYRAFKTLDIQTEPGAQLQAEVKINLPIVCRYLDVPVNLNVNGFYDRLYSDHFVETKLSGSPNYYTDLYYIQSQNATYFLADPHLEYCIMEVVKVPDLKSTKSYKNESVDEYEERTYQDIISRPSEYFIGWDREKRTFGKKFHRSEFNLDEVRDRYQFIIYEILNAEYERAKGNDSFYRNDKNCSNVLPKIPCDMLPICRHGNHASEERYEIRSDKNGKGDEW